MQNRQNARRLLQCAPSRQLSKARCHQIMHQHQFQLHHQGTYQLKLGDLV